MSRQNGNRQKNNIKVNKYFWSHLCMRLFYYMKSNLYSVFILECVPVASINIEHYMKGAIR